MSHGTRRERIVLPPLVRCALCGDRIRRDNRSRVAGDALCGPCRDTDRLLAERLAQDAHDALVYRQEAER